MTQQHDMNKEPQLEPVEDPIPHHAQAILKKVFPGIVVVYLEGNYFSMSIYFSMTFIKFRAEHFCTIFCDSLDAGLNFL